MQPISQKHLANQDHDVPTILGLLGIAWTMKSARNIHEHPILLSFSATVLLLLCRCCYGGVCVCWCWLLCSSTFIMRLVSATSTIYIYLPLYSVVRFPLFVVFFLFFLSLWLLLSLSLVSAKNSKKNSQSVCWIFTHRRWAWNHELKDFVVNELMIWVRLVACLNSGLVLAVLVTRVII